MLSQNNLAYREAEETLGQWHPLVDQLGSTEGLVTLGNVSGSLQLQRVDSLASLRALLEAYQTQMLIPIELPAIQRAYLHAVRTETRELIAFDQQMAGEPVLQNFAPASRRIGQFLLKRLRPLRDDRLLQRYLRAVEEKRAHGWHTLVFGVTLALYSLPVRQGMVAFERQMLRGFINTVARSLRLSESDCSGLLDEVCLDLNRSLETDLLSEELCEIRFR